MPVEAMRSTCNSPKNGHTRRNANAVSGTIESRDDRSIASAVAFSAVGAHINDNQNPWVTCMSNSWTNKECDYFARPFSNACTTD